MLLDQVFALGLLVVAAVAGGAVAKRVGIPPLLGMLIGGLAAKNLPGGVVDAIPSDWSISLRLIALTVILLRAGLGLDLDSLNRLRGAFLRLAFLPNLAEAGTVAVVAHLLLGLPWLWGLLLGFVIAAVSPAVVVPSLLDLQSKGYGVDKGIPTMVLAAATFDDVLAITGFGLSVSLIFGGGGDAGALQSVMRAPIELALGLGVGVTGGIIASAFLASIRPQALRTIALFALGLVAVFGGWAADFAGGGSLAAMTMGAVAARRWSDDGAPVAVAMSAGWAVVQPILFGLIGAAVVLADIQAEYVGYGLIVIVAGLAIRLGTTYLAVSSGQFNRLERAFIALAWIPKATVQAAIGALALDLARENQLGAEAIEYGNQVLTLAVLAIVITAPIGALAISRTGPRWLQQTAPSD